MSFLGAILGHNQPASEEQLGKLFCSSLRLGDAPTRQSHSGKCAIGIRSLAFSEHDAESLHQSRQVCVALAGRLDDRKSLLDAFGQNDDVSDVRLVTLAYQKWSKECAARLIGSFAAIIWDSEAETLLCIVDHVCSRPLYYSNTSDGVVVTSTIRQLRRVNPSAELDRGYFLARLTFPAVGALTSRKTPYCGISRLEPGAILVVAARRQPYVSRYWTPEHLPSTHGSLIDAGEQLRDCLETAVRAQTRSSRRVMLTLSGGLDSSSIAGLAVGLQRRAELPCKGLDSMALVYGGWADADEESFRAAAEQKYGLQAIRVDASQAWNFKMVGDKKAALGDEPSSTAAVGSETELIAAAAANAGCNVVLHGQGGDELFCGSEHLLSDLLQAHDLTAFWRQLKKFSRPGNRTYAFCLWSLAVAPLLARRLSSLTGVQWGATSAKGESLWYLPRAPHWLVSDAQSRELVEEVYAELSTMHVRPVPRAEEMWRIRLSCPTAPLNDTTFFQKGIEVRLPFYDRRVVELALSIPAQMKLKIVGRRRLIKRTMRAGFRHVLPWPITKRRTKTSTDFQQAIGLEKEWSQLCGVREFALADMGVVRGDVVRAMLRSARLGQCRSDLAQLRALLVSELWIRHVHQSD